MSQWFNVFRNALENVRDILTLDQSFKTRTGPAGRPGTRPTRA